MGVLYKVRSLNRVARVDAVPFASDRIMKGYHALYLSEPVTWSQAWSQERVLQDEVTVGMGGTRMIKQTRLPPGCRPIR